MSAYGRSRPLSEVSVTVRLWLTDPERGPPTRVPLTGKGTTGQAFRVFRSPATRRLESLLLCDGRHDGRCTVIVAETAPAHAPWTDADKHLGPFRRRDRLEQDHIASVRFQSHIPEAGLLRRTRHPGRRTPGVGRSAGVNRSGLAAATRAPRQRGHRQGERGKPHRVCHVALSCLRLSGECAIERGFVLAFSAATGPALRQWPLQQPAA